MSQVTNYDYNDYTDELLLIPNMWGLITNLGIFSTESVDTATVQFDETESTFSLIKDQFRGNRKKFSKGEKSKLHTIGVPHFPFDDAITPQDIIGKRKAGTKDSPEDLANVRMKKMERLRKSWAATLEYARMQAIRGIVYAPNGTNDVTNWYTEMGATQKVVNMALNVAGTNVIAKGEEALAHSQDNLLSGEVATDFIAICSPELFAALIAHDTVEEAYKYYSSTQDPLRTRLNSELGGRYREFTYGGVRYIEYRGSFGSDRIVPANEGYLLPLGTTDTFVTYYAPADKFEFVHTAGEEQYMFEYDDGRGEMIEIQSESNFINVVRRPQAVVKLTTTS
jgi:hypothetical protein